MADETPAPPPEPPAPVPTPAPAQAAPTPAAKPVPKIVPFHLGPMGKKVTPAMLAAARRNGKLGGVKKGALVPKRIVLAGPEDTANLIETAAQAIVAGKSLRTYAPRLPITETDKASLSRLMHIPAEEFNQRLSEKLGLFAEEVLDCMRQKLAEDKFKPGELAFPLAVALDKRANLDGRGQLANANVNVQVNNFNGPKSRDEMIRALKGLSSSTPIDVTPSPPPNPSP